jgi:hypothetical protein
MRPRLARARRLLVLAGVAALPLGGLAALPAAAAPAVAAAPRTVMVPDQPRCDSSTSYKLNKNEGWKWYAYDSGSVVNNSRATAHKSITHSSSESKSTTKSGEVGLTINAWVAQINGKYGYSVSKTVAYTTTTSFTVDVPPKTKIKYKDGIIVRKFKVKISHVYTDCRTATSYGHVYAADNRSEIDDA